MTCVIYVNWYLHMLRGIMIIYTYFHLYNSIEIIIYKLILHNIITFYGIVQTDIMIHKVIIVKYFLANIGNYMSYREQVRSYMLSTKTIAEELVVITHHKFSLYTHIQMWNIYIAFCLVLHVYMMMSKYMCKYCFFFFL